MKKNNPEHKNSSYQDSFKKFISTITNSDILLIAEAGTSHMGSLSRAYQLIDEISKTKIKCLKFQYVIAEEILHPDCGEISLPSGNIQLYDYFKQLESPLSFYKYIQNYCEQKGIFFLCSPFGITTAQNLDKLNVKAFKIASPELNHNPLLKEVAKYNKPLFLSTGMAYHDDIANAVNFLKNENFSQPLSILQCVTSYPTPPENYNLMTLFSIYQSFNTIPGVSDHSSDPFIIPLITTTISAILELPVILEKHITLNQNGVGLDDPFALSISQLQSLHDKMEEVYIKTSKKKKGLPEQLIPHILSNILKNDYSKIKKDADSLSNFIHKILPEYSAPLILSILGDGKKKPAPSEADNYYTSRRSLLATQDIKTGEKIDAKNSSFLRSEKNLNPGMTCQEFDKSSPLFADKNIKNSSAITTKNTK